MLWNSNILGRFLFLLPKLKTLRLAHCSNLQTAHMHKAVAAMSDRLSKSFYDALQYKRPNWEILQVACIDACYDSIALLPKLRVLGLFCDNKFAMHTSVFQALAEKRANELESLQICSRQCLSAEQCQLIAKEINRSSRLLTMAQGSTVTWTRPFSTTRPPLRPWFSGYVHDCSTKSPKDTGSA